MQWIRTGRQIGQAVKNVQRLRQIVAVFARHGFVDVLDRMDLGRFLPQRMALRAEVQSERTTAERLRLALEELGPTFVKFGQLLSTRPDLVPEGFIAELTKLQDNVQVLPFERVKTVVEAELKRPLAEAYAAFDPTPLAAASIGQVHAATLHTGERVVVKVQRPEIDRVIDTDVALMQFLAGLLEKYVPEARVANPRVFVEEFFQTLEYELDFVIEAANIAKMSENLAGIPEIVLPRVHKSLSTSKVLTMERFEGIRVNDLAALDAAGVDRKFIVSVGARAFFRSVLIDGLFHGDLHAGNLFVLPGNRLGVIDFGIVGRLSERARNQLANMVMALLTEDYENLCYMYAELGNASAAIDFDNFQREVRNTLSPYMGLPLHEIDLGRVLVEATKIAARYRIQVPGDWMIVFKAILTLEGMGRKLDPDFDLLATGRELVRELVKSQYSVDRISKDLLWVAKDMAALLQVLPRQLRWMFRKLNANDFALEVRLPELKGLRAQLETNGQRQALSVTVAGLFVAASIALHFPDERHKIAGYPPIAMLLFGAGTFLLLRMLSKRSR
jgi:ubiquinone biosynthesis protein